MRENEQTGKRYELKTRGHHDLMEVRSALQKAIRRSETESALYWANELYRSNFEAYLIYSLGVVLAEEFSPLADPALYGSLCSSMNFWSALLTERKKKKQKTELRPAIGNWIITMCSTTMRKSRIGDDAWMWVETRRKLGWRLEIPSVALDEHCARGREQGRGYKFWVMQSSRIHPSVSAQELGIGKDYTALINAWYIKNSPVPNENDWSAWDPNDPDAEIVEYPVDDRENGGDK